MPSALPHESTGPGWQVNILLVDDQPANLLVLQAILDGLGYNLVEARSGEEALRRLQKDEFAVVLLDVLMPVLDGFQTARRIRSQEKSRHTPIIFVSAFESADFPVIKAYSLGAVDFLYKPLVPEILRAKVAGLVELYEQKLQVKRQSEQLRLLIEGTTDYAIFMLDPTGRIVTWNIGAERITGYRAEEIIGQQVARFYPEEAIAGNKAKRELEQAIATGKYEEEAWRVRKDGSRFWASVVIVPLRDEAGAIRGFSKVIRDVTERKQAEENARRLLEEQAARRAIRENEERLRFALTAGRMIAWDWNLATGHCVRSDTAGSILGLQTGNVEEYKRKIHPEDRPRFDAVVDRTVRGEGPYEIEYRVIAPDGRILWLVDRAEPRFREDLPPGSSPGPPVRLVGVSADITAIKEAEAALRASEQRFRQLADAMPQIVWTAQPDGQPEYFNQRWYQFTGLSPDVPAEFQGGQAIIHPEDLEPALQRWQEALRTGSRFQMELRLKEKRTGIYRWFLARSVPIRDEAGEILRWYGTSTNIDDQKHAEQASRFLAEASATLASLIDFESTLQKVARLAVPYFADWCLIDIKEPDGKLRRLAVSHVDPAKIEWVHEVHRRFPPDPGAASGLYQVLRTGHSEMVSEITENLLAGASDEEYRRILRELGLKSYLCVPMLLRGQALGVITFVTAESGRLYGPNDLQLAEDLAHRAAIAVENARLYHELKEAGRRKDEFLAMLAHELRNPLAPIRNALQIMKMPGASPSAIENARQMTERQVKHMVRLVDDLLDVSRIMQGKIELRKEPTELAPLVTRALETVQHILDAQGQKLILSLPPEPLRLEADQTRLTQVIGNLLHNAAKYSQGPSRVWLSAAREGNEIVVRIKDEGVGIRPELLPHIFDLFVQGDRSLERSQGGLGIGLTVVRRLVELHGGTISVHSEGVGKGSEFVVRLPALPESAQPNHTAKASGPSSAPRSARRVLVVDDNVDAAESVAMLLRMWGHEVRLAHTGPDALVAAEEFSPEIVVLDIGLPGMSGYEVARRLRQQPTFARTVLAAVTGYGQEEDRRRSQDAGFNYHLTKPVEPETLLRLVADLLGKWDGVPNWRK